MKKFCAFLLSVLILLSLAACGGSKPAPSTQDASDSAEKVYTINVAGIDGDSTLFPMFVAQHFGWFEDAGLTVNYSGFSNGPVQMEAIDSWDIGFTGIGGILAGSISYDAIMLGASKTDDGQQAVFVRPEGAIAAAGTGHNTEHPDVVGDTDSWRGASINCANGTIQHYTLKGLLEGFGLTIDDVNANWMDIPTASAAFVAGEGDAACSSGAARFAADKKPFVRAATGNQLDLGLLINIVANPAAYADAEKQEAMKIFLEQHFRAVDWIAENHDEALDLLVDFCDDAGIAIDESNAAEFLDADHFYTAAENYDELHTSAGDGICVMQEKVVNILNFFISVGNYKEGDDEIFLQPEHIDTTLIDQLCEEKN